MSTVPAFLMLADSDLFDPRLWIFLVLLLGGGLSKLFKKKKDGEPGQANTQQRQTMRGPARPQPQPPIPPQAARPRTPPQPQIEPVSRAPSARPAPRSTHARPRPQTTADPLAGLQAELRQAVLAAEEPERSTPKRKPAEAVRAAPEGGGAVRRQVDSLLAQRSGLRAAFVLSELLAPPLALREDHLT